jgi:hypothetical protein
MDAHKILKTSAVQIKAYTYKLILHTVPKAMAVFIVNNEM